MSFLFLQRMNAEVIESLRGEDFSKWLKIILFCPLQQVGSRWWWWVVVEEKGWERRNASVSLPAAGTGKGRRLHSERPRAWQRSPVQSLCVCSDADRSARPRPCRTMSARSALILRGLPLAPFRDGARLAGARGLKLSALGFPNAEIPYSQAGTLASPASCSVYYPLFKGGFQKVLIF